MILTIIQQEKKAQPSAQEVAQLPLLWLPFAFMWGDACALLKNATSSKRKLEINLWEEEFAGWIACRQNLVFYHATFIL